MHQAHRFGRLQAAGAGLFPDFIESRFHPIRNAKRELPAAPAQPVIAEHRRARGRAWRPDKLRRPLRAPGAIPHGKAPGPASSFQAVGALRGILRRPQPFPCSHRPVIAPFTVWALAPPLCTFHAGLKPGRAGERPIAGFPGPAANGRSSPIPRWPPGSCSAPGG